jgi:hypothetical protein
MGRARVGALNARRLHIRDVALSGEAWPEDVRKIANNAHNQFETPILFYVLCGAATYLGVTGPVMAFLAWGYIATRLVHTFIHVTTNRVRHRFYAFTAGMAVLFSMWLVLAVRLAGAD